MKKTKTQKRQKCHKEKKSGAKGKNVQPQNYLTPTPKHRHMGEQQTPNKNTIARTKTLMIAPARPVTPGRQIKEGESGGGTGDQEEGPVA